MQPATATYASPWPHRFAVLLCLVTFPLIWVGGLVTTYDAGMAVPDWPTTYGYNMFLYPPSTWLAGPFDLFVEHGHRLLGSLAGLVTIGLVVSIFRTETPSWLRGLSVGAFLLVVAQGSLGGLRVVLDSRTFAMIHGCVGPAFFALAASLAVVTSRSWREGATHDWARSGSVRRLAPLVAVLAYIQLLIGAQLRHVPVTASTDVFRVAVVFHLIMAAAVVAHVVMLAWKGARCPCKSVSRGSLLLAAVALAQVALGCGTWIMKYGWPAGLGNDFAFAAGHQIVAHGYWQSMITTAHVAVGSLILALSASLTVRAYRHLRPAVAIGSAPVLWGLSS